MIISHRHRYLFVETPHTASTAIAHELQTNYAGEPVLHKHASYAEFLRQATPEERTFFAFAGMRHPMDVTVSIYERIASDHNGRYSQPRPAIRTNPHYQAEIEQFHWIRRTKADFRSWFLSHAMLPYDDWMAFDRGLFSAIIRFEHLHADFAAVLSQLGLEQVRPLPVMNATQARQRDYAAYYPPNTWSQAAYFFGPYIEITGYSFPPGWGSVEVPRRARVLYRVLRPFRRLARVHRRGLSGRALNGMRRGLHRAIRMSRRVRPVVIDDR